MTEQELAWVNFTLSVGIGLYLLVTGSSIPAFFLGALAGMNGAWLIEDHRRRRL